MCEVFCWSVRLLPDINHSKYSCTCLKREPRVNKTVIASHHNRALGVEVAMVGWLLVQDDALGYGFQWSLDDSELWLQYSISEGQAGRSE